MSESEQPSELIKSTNLTEFFKDSVEDAANNQHLDARPDTVFYIVNLLTQYSRANRLFTQSESGPQICSLAELQMRALTDETDQTRIASFRELGDLALLLAGVFTDYLYRRGINVDYCSNIGGDAYEQLANYHADDRRTDGLDCIFKELAQKFDRFVDVVAEASSHSLSTSDQTLLALYERWLERGHPRDEIRLRRLGVFPSANNNLNH